MVGRSAIGRMESGSVVWGVLARHVMGIMCMEVGQGALVCSIVL